MKNTIKLLTMLLAVIMMIQAAPLSAIGDSADLDTYDQHEEHENVIENESSEAEPETEAPETEAEPETEVPEPETEVPELETEPETDAEVEQITLAIESIDWKDGTLDEAFAPLTDNMTVTCNYVIIRLACNAAPESVEVYVDGVAVKAEILENSVLLPIEMLNGYHTFAFTVNGAANTVTAEFGLTVNSTDTTYPAIQLGGASDIMLGEIGKILITGSNTDSLAEILVNIKISTEFKVKSVDIAKGYVGTYSWFRGDLKLNLAVNDASKIADEVIAIIYVQAPATVTPGADLSIDVESAVVTPAEGESVGKSEHFHGVVSVPNAEIAVVESYTLSGISAVAIGGMNYTLNVKNSQGKNAAGVSVYVVNGKQNILLGITDSKGNLTIDYFVDKGIYKVFAQDDNGGCSYVTPITCYESVGPVDGTPYSVLFNNAITGGKSLSWMSNVLCDSTATIRVATLSDMSDAVLYYGISFVKTYDTSMAVNRVNSVTVDGLTPGVYYYQVGDGTVWSETKAFTVKDADSVSFGVIGDMANTDSANLELIAGAMANSGVEYDFAIQTGNAINDTADYNAWLNTVNSFASFGDLSFIHAYGKNETDAANVFVSEYGYRYYIYNNVFVAVIDYTEDADLLESMLLDMVWDAKAADYAWSILVINQAPYTTDAEKASGIVADMVPEMAERGGIDLVLSGDECNFARTESLRKGKVTVKNGVTYMVCGSAGEKAGEITNGEFSVTDSDFNALYISVTADQNSLVVTVYDVLADGTVEVIDSFTKTQHACDGDSHMYRFGINSDYLICDYCGAKEEIVGYEGVISMNDQYMYFQSKGFASGWKMHDGKYYYFSPKNYLAVDGVQTINGFTYVFEDCVLVEGCWVTHGSDKRLMWGGSILTSTWHTQAGKTYYFLSNGVCATGTVQIPTVNENGETVMETYLFDEDGSLIGKQ